MDIQVEKRLIELKEGSFIFEFNDSLGKNECDDIIKRFENHIDVRSSDDGEVLIQNNLVNKPLRYIKDSGKIIFK